MVLSKVLKNAAQMMSEENYMSARDLFYDAISLSPPPIVLAEIYFQLGVSLLRLDDYTAAEEGLFRAAELLNSQGIDDTGHISETLIVLYESSGQADKLREYCENILSRDEMNGDAAAALASIYIHDKDYAAAARITRPLMDAGTDNRRAFYSGLVAEARTKQFEPALRHAKEYLNRFGYDRQLILLIGDIYHDLGVAAEMVYAYEEAYNDSDDEGQFYLSEYLLANSLYDEIYDKHKIREILMKRHSYSLNLIRNNEFDNEPRFFKKLKIGYLSGNFRKHPVGYFLIPVFEQRSAGHGDYVCYSYVDPDYKDGVSELIFDNSSEVFDLYGKSDDFLEEFILDDKPDIMMELNSLTKGNKLNLYAGRLAPVQISWIGFPCSTGIAAIDHIITDRIVDPYPEAQELFNEKLLYLKDTFLCCQLPVPESSGKSAFDQNGYITFGCFNNYIKITDRMLQNWARILSAIKGSKIKFKSLKYGTDSVVKLLRERLDKFGFDPESYIIEKESAIANYYGCYDDIDIVLDTYPFNGATTTFDALLMGTPLVTLAGELHHSRVGLSLLSHVGLSNLVCYSDSEYVDCAVALAGDTERLRHLKQTLRGVTQNSKLYDAAAFGKEYEHALRKAWIEYCVKIGGGDIYRGDHVNAINLSDELVNGCHYIIKSARDGELNGEMRNRLLDEIASVLKSYIKEAVSANPDIEANELLALIHRSVDKLKDLDNDYVSKILELTLDLVRGIDKTRRGI